MRSILTLFTIAFAFIFATTSAHAETTQPWVQQKSGAKTLTFTGTQMGASFTGQFSDFETHIIFDPQDLDNSTARVEISLSSAVTGDAERDETLQNDEWFNSQAFPIATFETNSISRAKDGADYSFIAKGTLTIASVKQEIVLPFSFDIDKAAIPMTAKAQGKTILNRIDFGLGADNWKNEDSIGYDVIVSFELDLIKTTE